MTGQNSDHEMGNSKVITATQAKDLQQLWDQWDEAQQMARSTQLFKGWNLIGLSLIIVGFILQVWGPVALKIISSGCMVAGGIILAVKKFKSLRQK